MDRVNWYALGTALCLGLGMDGLDRRAKDPNSTLAKVEFVAAGILASAMVIGYVREKQTSFVEEFLKVY